MKILTSAVQRLGVGSALEHGRNVLGVARQAADPFWAAKKLKRIVGEVAARAFMVTAFRAPLSLLIQDYSEDILSDAEMLPSVAYRASLEREIKLFKIISEGTLRDLMHGEMTFIENQLDGWGFDIFDTMGASVFPDALSASELDFVGKDVWMSVEHFFSRQGVETPYTGSVPFTPYRAALAHEVERRGVESDLRRVLGMHQYALTIYSAFLANREELENAVRLGILSSPAMR